MWPCCGMLRPPWGDDIDPSVTNLANYFVTSNGKSLLDEIDAALTEAIETNQAVLVE